MLSHPFVNLQITVDGWPADSGSLPIVYKVPDQGANGPKLPSMNDSLHFSSWRRLQGQGQACHGREDPVITGRRGHLRALDGYFAGVPVSAIGSLIRNFVNDRKVPESAGQPSTVICLSASDVQAR